MSDITASEEDGIWKAAAQGLPGRWGPRRGCDRACGTPVLRSGETEPEGHVGKNETRLQILDLEWQVKQLEVKQNTNPRNLPYSSVHTYPVAEGLQGCSHAFPTTFSFAFLCN